MDPMNDATLERDIERALAIEPSPEFLARVRTRIAQEPSASSWRFSGLFAGVAAVTVAAAVALAVFVEPPARSTAPSRAPLLASRSIATSIVVPSVVAAGPKGPALHSNASRMESRRPGPFGPGVDVATAPEPLFDPRETMALQRLIAGVRDARVDLTPLLKEAPPAPMALQPVDDLVIPSLTIEPLVPGGVEGERP